MLALVKLSLMLAMFLACSLVTVSALNPSTVDNSTKLSWCQNQVGFCTNVCEELTKGATTQINQCDIQSLEYACVCQGNVVPNITEYTYTIPYFACTYDVQSCIHACALSDNACYSGCQSRNCAAEFPKKYNQTIPTSLSGSATPTAGTLPTGTIPPNIFGNTNNAYSTKSSGASLLGLSVFLAVGVLFGHN